ncbi:putative mediator of RNA polymerase II transcription subunit 19b [Capsicum chinense]|nr:putative mediator of RNA polymerase II transcription subunit 19b [Capsicum annuum]PHU24728.1 putative mediator of RNA polymerase II transcription subunit 19b [Capsicum chinense]
MCACYFVSSGSRELGGSVDLLDHYKLGKHLDFFCKRSLPPSISGTQYLRNVVGDTEIKKGEGMELNQLSKNSSYVRHQRVHLHPFGLDLLTDAFQLREATSADHLLEGIVLPSGAPNLKNEYKEKKQHKKIKHRDGLRKQDPSSCIDKDHMLNRDNDKEKNGSTELWSRFFPETASKGSPNLVTTSIHYAEPLKFFLKLGSDHLALVSEFEFLEVVGDKKEATEDRIIS